MYGFVYVTINKINNRKYVGRRKYSAGWQNYLGSGMVLKTAIDKYGESNFERVILEDFLCEESLYAGEKSYISYFRQAGEDLYNLSDGGKDGFGTKHNPSKLDARREELSRCNSSRVLEPGYVVKYNLSHPGESNPAKREDARRKISENNPMKKPEHVQKISGDNHYMRDENSDGYKKVMGLLKTSNPMFRPEIAKLHSDRMRGDGNVMRNPEIRKTQDKNFKAYLESDKYKLILLRRSKKFFEVTRDGILMFESIQSCLDFYGGSLSTLSDYLRRSLPYRGHTFVVIDRQKFYSWSECAQRISSGVYLLARRPTKYLKR